MNKSSPIFAHVCEFEPSVSTIPDIFITGVGFVEFPVSIKYLQEDILGRPESDRCTSKTESLESEPKNKTYLFVRTALAADRVNTMRNDIEEVLMEGITEETPTIFPRLSVEMLLS
jgi:hypothetical protein